MARIVRCPSCGAAHRVVSGQTQLRCDYCRTVVRADLTVSVEEWFSAAPLDRSLSLAIATHEMRRVGVTDFDVVVEGVRCQALWQIVSTDGEEHRLAATAPEHPLLAQLGIPSVSFAPRDRSQWEQPLPELRCGREEAEAAALASFSDPDPSVQAARLFWFCYHPLRIRVGHSELQGLHVPGDERIWLESLPLDARRRPANSSLLWRYAAYASLAFVLGAAIADGWQRAFAVGGACALATLLWSGPLKERRP